MTAPREATPWQAIGIFLLLITCLTGIFWGGHRYPDGHRRVHFWWDVDAGRQRAAHLPDLRRPFATLGLGTWNWRYVLIGYLTPIAYCLVASLGAWLLGFGGFPNTDFVNSTAHTLGLTGTPDWIVIVVFVLLQGTVGMVTGVAVATGE